MSRMLEMPKFVREFAAGAASEESQNAGRQRLHHASHSQWQTALGSYNWHISTLVIIGSHSLSSVFLLSSMLFHCTLSPGHIAALLGGEGRHRAASSIYYHLAPAAHCPLSGALFGSTCP